MIKIGVTGGIGSGKTTVCKIIQDKYNIPVYYSDIRAEFIRNNNEELKEKIVKTFGEDCYKNGLFDRKYIADLIFNDKNKLKEMNELFAPYMLADFELFCECFKNFRVILFESAIIFENNREKLFDKIICVYASEQVVRKRLIEKRWMTEEAIQSVLSSQMDVQLKIKKSDYFIDTTGENEKEIERRIKQILKLIGEDL